METHETVHESLSPWTPPLADGAKACQDTAVRTYARPLPRQRLIAPRPTSAAASAVMRGNRKRDTKPELAIRRAVHRTGGRYEVAARPLRGRPWTADLVFRRPRVAVFVDGCYWHGCPQHFKLPSANLGYWGTKIERNRERDSLVDAELSAAGWTVIRIWEHEEPEAAAAQIVRAVRPARAE